MHSEEQIVISHFAERRTTLARPKRKMPGTGKEELRDERRWRTTSTSPGFGKRLKDEHIADLIAFIRTW